MLLKSAANSMSFTVRLPPPPPPPTFLGPLLLPPQAIVTASTSTGKMRREKLKNGLELDTGEGLLDIVVFLDFDFKSLPKQGIGHDNPIVFKKLRILLEERSKCFHSNGIWSPDGPSDLLRPMSAGSSDTECKALLDAVHIVSDHLAVKKLLGPLRQRRTMFIRGGESSSVGLACGRVAAMNFATMFFLNERLYVQVPSS